MYLYEKSAFINMSKYYPSTAEGVELLLATIDFFLATSNIFPFWQTKPIQKVAQKLTSSTKLYENIGRQNILLELKLNLFNLLNYNFRTCQNAKASHLEV